MDRHPFLICMDAETDRGSSLTGTWYFGFGWEVDVFLLSCAQGKNCAVVFGETFTRPNPFYPVLFFVDLGNQRFAFKMFAFLNFQEICFQ